MKKVLEVVSLSCLHLLTFFLIDEVRYIFELAIIKDAKHGISTGIALEYGLWIFAMFGLVSSFLMTMKKDRWFYMALVCILYSLALFLTSGFFSVYLYLGIIGSISIYTVQCIVFLWRRTGRVGSMHGL